MDKKERLKQLLLKKKTATEVLSEVGGRDKTKSLKVKEERKGKGESDIDSRFVETIYDPR